MNTRRETKETKQPLVIPDDCFECKVTGTTCALALGSYVLYNSRIGRFNGGRGHQAFMRLVAAGKFYI